MTYLAPLALFVFFLGVIVLMGRERGPLRGKLGGPTVDQRRAVRGFLVVMTTAWVIGVAAMLGPDDLRPLVALAGLLITAAGVAVSANYRGVREALSQDEQNWGLGNRWAGAVIVVIGVGWLVVGALELT